MSKTIKYTILFIYSVISIIVISVSLFDLLKCLIHFTNLSYNDFLLNIFEKLFPLLVFLIYCFPLLLINRYFLFKQNETKAKYLNLLGKVILGIFILFTFIPNSLISRSKYSKIEEHWQSYRTTFDEVIRTPFLDGEKLKLKTLSITIPKTLNREDFKINESLPVSFYGEINYKDFDVDFYAFYKFFNVKSDLGVFEKIGSITLDDLKVVRSLFGLRAFAEYSIFFRTMAYKEVTIINYGGHKVVLTLNEYSKKVYSLLYLQNEKIIKDIKIVSDVKINKEAILKICDSIQILN